jgi:hypothetical protein
VARSSGAGALAAQASTGFRRELNENLEALQRVQPKHLAMSSRLKAAAATPRPGQTAFDAFMAARPDGGVSIPALSDEESRQAGRAAVRREDATGAGIG